MTKVSRFQVSVEGKRGKTTLISGREIENIVVDGRRLWVAPCEVCEMDCAHRVRGTHTAWEPIDAAGMVEDVEVEIPSSFKGGLSRAAWVCSDECERAMLAALGRDPSTAGLR